MRKKELRVALSIGLSDSYEHGVVRGIVRYARERRNWRLYGAGWMFRGLGNIDSWEGDGIIARAESEAAARSLARTGIPVVDVAGAYTMREFAAVTNDDYRTGRSAGDYLLRSGFTNFAFCGVRDTAWSRARLAGFRAGTTPEVRTFEQTLAWWERPEEFGPLADWIRSLAKPSALFACNDTAGTKVTAVCRRLGIEVPAEVAVLGVDNEDILCELSDPPLSSIPLDCETIGYRAAETLDQLLEKVRRSRRSGGANERSAAPQRPAWKPPAIVPPGPLVVAPLPIVERASTQTLPSTDAVVRQAADYIRRLSGSAVRVSEVASAVNVSRRTLELRFRSATGRTVHEEIVRVRLQLAARLLRETNLPVRAIAEQCGIATVQRFYAQFRRSEGCTPGEYRKANGQRRR